MPAFLVALMFVVFLMLSLTALLVIARVLRREEEAVERHRHPQTGVAPNPQTEEH